MGAKDPEQGCSHRGFCLDPYTTNPSWRPSLADRLGALPSGPSSKDGKGATKAEDYAHTSFPALQALPGDALDADHFEVDADPQSFQNWRSRAAGRVVNKIRNTIYVVPPPNISEEVEFLASWKTPKVRKGQQGERASPPTTEDVMQYIRAFYWPIPVKQHPLFEFIKWESDDKVRSAKRPRKKSTSTAVLEVGLADRLKNEATRIQCRRVTGQPYSHQVSVNDVIDAMIVSLPEDACNMVLLLDHDLYEDPEDDFVIGRAYGGSRVCCVSMARYDPYLDLVQNISPHHSWPLTYCIDFLKDQGGTVPKSKIVRLNSKTINTQAPVLSALKYEMTESLSSSPNKMWLFRVCRTVSHELGHCFGIGHCIYYGCIMQSTANAAEDARQPAYLCPIDFAKVQGSTGVKEVEWCSKMAETCLVLGPEGGFGTLAAWLSARAKELE